MSRPFALDSLLRPNVLRLKPYSSARDEFEGEAEIYLDAWGLRDLGPAVLEMAESLSAHARAVSVRLAHLQSQKP